MKKSLKFLLTAALTVLLAVAISACSPIDEVDEEPEQDVPVVVEEDVIS
ncbi:MAG: hypothetical protein LBL35_06785 [Clostridiales bacterium]|jgi:hypothetical protein|nr:hypothetical protein [Clostridiales bacterium]